jgi:DNA-binding Lrp family transcriptional regulator
MMESAKQMGQVVSVKEIELKLVAELLKNSHRSDRELAKALGVSQPTISRLTERLRKMGVIREYTIIPDFHKLGFHICALTFADFVTPSDLEAMRKLIEEYGKRLSEIPQAVMIERGLGENANGVVISLHKDYSDYSNFQNWMKQFIPQSKFVLHTFLINLDDQIHYRYLTFSTLARHLLEMQKQAK